MFYTSLITESIYFAVNKLNIIIAADGFCHL